MTYRKTKTENGIELCYEVFGEIKDRTPIILVSGAGLQMLGWPDGFCSELAARGIPVIRFDNRDTGESTSLSGMPAPTPWLVALKHQLGIKPRCPYQLEDMATDLVQFMDNLKIEKAHLVGISLGGMISQVAAIRHETRVRSLTLISTQARNSRHTMPKIGTVMKMMKSARPGREGYIEWNIDLVRIVGGEAAKAPDDYLRDIAGRMYDRGINEPGMFRHVCASYASSDRRKALSGITTPTLVIHGSDDPLIHVEASREIADSVRNSRFHIIEGMGHGILKPAWPKLIELIRDHTRTVDATE